MEKEKNNILVYRTHNKDWYICTNPLNGEWGKINEELVNVDELFSSDADGYENTKILVKHKGSIFEQAYNTHISNGFVGYIPSWVEIDELREHLDEINTFLRIKGMNQISLDNIWTSESFDENNAWNSNGEVLPKSTELNYYIFGKILWV